MTLPDPYKEELIRLVKFMIGVTFAGLLCYAEIGREGPICAFWCVFIGVITARFMYRV